ncbi:MAG: hypothetical protein V2I46_00605 [Bacteroides sp.]|jgi:hypothetical protein|nr:hypothetical protein [Bacteroides sp.]
MHQEIKDRIIHLLEEIVERAHSINQQDQGNADLEIDLVMEDLRSLYRQFDLLRRHANLSGLRAETPEFPTEEVQAKKETENQTFAETAETPETENQEKAEQTPNEEPEEEMPAEPESQTPVHEEIPVIEENLQPEPVEEPEPEPEPEKEAESAPVKEIAPKPVAKPGKESVQKPHPPRMNGPHSVLDLFSTGAASRNVGESLEKEDNSLHKRIIAQKEDRSIGTRLQMTPISNLKDAIGVNEKFLFINELFGGNIQVYNESVARLNEFKDMQEAFGYLNELNDLLGWDEKRSAQTIEKLANFVQRRYMDR